jgi:hypothetical protein
MAAASIETALELWASSLRAVKARIRPHPDGDDACARRNGLQDQAGAGDRDDREGGVADVRFAWVAAGDVEMALRRAGKAYVLGVISNHHFNSWQRNPAVAGTAEQIASALDASHWQRLSAGEGTKGSRLHDWAYCELADLDIAEYAPMPRGL